MSLRIYLQKNFQKSSRQTRSFQKHKQSLFTNPSDWYAMILRKKSIPCIDHESQCCPGEIEKKKGKIQQREREKGVSWGEVFGDPRLIG